MPDISDQKSEIKNESLKLAHTKNLPIFKRSSFFLAYFLSNFLAFDICNSGGRYYPWNELARKYYTSTYLQYFNFNISQGFF